MKVVHVTTVDVGGAATAAYRLHKGLLKAGIDSKFLVLYNTDSHKDVIIFKTPKSDFVGFFFRKVKHRILRFSFKKSLSELNSEIEIFTSPHSIYDIAAHPIIRNSDIIHFHWIANFVDYKNFFKRNHKPLVWTFHDENPIYGGVHYSGDIKKLPLMLQRLENRFKKTKQKALASTRKIWPICPSPWLMKEVISSPYKKIFENVKCIYYGIDTEEFCLINKSLARTELNLPIEKKLILFICTDFSVHRKGFDLFYGLTKMLTDYKHVEFIVAGEIADLPSLRNSRYIGSVKDQATLIRLYNAVDATLIPSREDNLPNVMIESLTCGTPVLGFKIGGIQNIIDDYVDGLLATEVSVQSLHSLMLKFLEIDTFDRESIRSRAVDRFGNKVQVEKVTKLYQDCIQYNY